MIKKKFAPGGDRTLDPRLIRPMLYLTELQELVHRVGFEPTRANTFDLESNPLDLLGHLCLVFLGMVPELQVLPIPGRVSTADVGSPVDRLAIQDTPRGGVSRILCPIFYLVFVACAFFVFYLFLWLAPFLLFYLFFSMFFSHLLTHTTYLHTYTHYTSQVFTPEPGESPAHRHRQHRLKSSSYAGWGVG